MVLYNSAIHKTTKSVIRQFVSGCVSGCACSCPDSFTVDAVGINKGVYGEVVKGRGEYGS